MTPDEHLGNFFNDSHNTYVRFDNLRRYSGTRKASGIIKRIRERIENEAALGVAVQTSGTIGDDGAGLEEKSSFSRAYDNVMKGGKIWYHWDGELYAWGLSRMIPNSGSECTEIPYKRSSIVKQ
ncbi:MAG: hypothetical protein HYX24_05180 [Candidatus Aenigmarchaeota archaeon]|nr:hypothetical protein [Candidatus Aenigmarchaeota archaeon]